MVKINMMSPKGQLTMGLASSVISVSSDDASGERVVRRTLLATNVDGFLAHFGNPDNPVYAPAMAEISREMQSASTDAARIEQLLQVAHDTSMNAVLLDVVCLLTDPSVNSLIKVR